MAEIGDYGNIGRYGRRTRNREGHALVEIVVRNVNMRGYRAYPEVHVGPYGAIFLEVNSNLADNTLARAK